jgi:hypothetical protein
MRVTSLAVAGQTVPTAGAAVKRRQNLQSGQGQHHDQHGTIRCLAHRDSPPLLYRRWAL